MLHPVAVAVVIVGAKRLSWLWLVKDAYDIKCLACRISFLANAGWVRIDVHAREVVF